MSLTLEELNDFILKTNHPDSVDDLCRTVVDEIDQKHHFPLTQLWLLKPGDLCNVCIHGNECLKESHCFQLEASSHPYSVEKEDGNLPHEHRPNRVPLSLGNLFGKADNSASGQLLGRNFLVRPSSITLSEMTDLSIHEFPLTSNDSLVGVLLVYFPSSLPDDVRQWLGTVLLHAATAISRAIEFTELVKRKRQLEMENIYLREEVRDINSVSDIVGKSSHLRNILHHIEVIAPTNASILIVGESGTGKGLVAREIHKRSKRRNKPLVEINCSGTAMKAMEAQLFGDCGNVGERQGVEIPGRLLIANGGTVYLNEIGGLPVELQEKILGILENGWYEWGKDGKREVLDIRIIASTTKELRSLVDKGLFLPELYYRLNIFPIEALPLRYRKDDIEELTEYFVSVISRKMNCNPPKVTKRLIGQLKEYDWPGNVRELQNVIERLLILSPAREKLELDDLGNHPAILPKESGQSHNILSEEEMRSLEKENILRALDYCGGKIYGDNGAAELLGLKPTTLMSRIKKIGLDNANVFIHT